MSLEKRDTVLFLNYREMKFLFTSVVPETAVTQGDDEGKTAYTKTHTHSNAETTICTHTHTHKER
jgi:hypothetical protein